MNIFYWLKNCLLGRGRAEFLYQRGMRKAKKCDHAGALRDYTTTIDMPGIPADLRAMLLYRRALVHVAAGDEAKGTDDLESLLAMKQAVVNVKTMARQELAKIASRSSDTNK